MFSYHVIRIWSSPQNKFGLIDKVLIFFFLSFRRPCQRNVLITFWKVVSSPPSSQRQVSLGLLLEYFPHRGRLDDQAPSATSSRTMPTSNNPWQWRFKRASEAEILRCVIGPLLQMGKLCCVGPNEDGVNVMGLLMALVIALVLMLICSPQPRRRAFIVFPPRFWKVTTKHHRRRVFLLVCFPFLVAGNFHT